MENPFEIILQKLESIESQIQQLKSKSDAVEFMSISQVADFIGLSKATVYSLTHRKEIPHFKTGKRLYFKKDEIIQWITSSKVITNYENNLKVDEYLHRNCM